MSTFNHCQGLDQTSRIYLDQVTLTFSNRGCAKLQRQVVSTTQSITQFHTITLVEQMRDRLTWPATVVKYPYRGSCCCCPGNPLPYWGNGKEAGFSPRHDQLFIMFITLWHLIIKHNVHYGLLWNTHFVRYKYFHLKVQSSLLAYYANETSDTFSLTFLKL